MTYCNQFTTKIVDYVVIYTFKVWSDFDLCLRV